MALIKCTECGQIISDRATKCPKCGCPITKNEEKYVSTEASQVQPVYYKKDKGGSSRKWLYGIIAILLAMIIIGSYYLYKKNQVESNSQQNLITDSIVNDSIAAVEAERKAMELKAVTEIAIKKRLNAFSIYCKETNDTYCYESGFLSNTFAKLLKNEVYYASDQYHREAIGIWGGTFGSSVGVYKLSPTTISILSENKALVRVMLTLSEDGEYYYGNDAMLTMILENGKWQIDDVVFDGNSNLESALKSGMSTRKELTSD